MGDLAVVYGDYPVRNWLSSCSIEDSCSTNNFHHRPDLLNGSMATFAPTVSLDIGK